MDAAAWEHDSALGRWSYAWQRPSPPLRGLIGGYTGYRTRLAVPATHRGIPSATLPLVINLGPRMAIALPDSAQRPVRTGSFVAGLHDGHVLIDAVEHHGIQVDLGPIAATRLLGRPLGELTGQVVDLEHVLGRDADRLIDDLASATDWPSRFRRLDRELTARLTAHDGDGHGVDAEVVQAFGLIRSSNGRARVTELAAATGWSPRRLSRRFGHTFGLPPKRMARLTRFEHAMALMTRNQPPGLATVAALTGFADQAHLTNEVRAFTGLSPTALLARQLPDDGGVFDLDHA